MLIMYQGKVRYYSQAGLEQEDATQRILHRYQQQVQIVSAEQDEKIRDSYNVKAISKN